ncbi:zinc finger protein Aiolos-like isoform X2 [Sander lucioperca]|uniref:zinc finger protein Aiolos-like isoform X2 n=1 Tax=Sander lucioperca TaxID=283035 RepID=UPI001653A451|nr:zinc finger protein Aiolos-like isoform X2 [Sander lucioperca]
MKWGPLVRLLQNLPELNPHPLLITDCLASMLMLIALNCHCCSSHLLAWVRKLYRWGGERIPHQAWPGPCLALDTCDGVHLERKSSGGVWNLLLREQSPLGAEPKAEHLFIMNTDKDPEFTAPEGNRMDICSDVADAKPQEEEEEREDNLFSENGMQCAESVTDPLDAIKTEAEENEDSEPYPKAEKKREIALKEEAEGASEDGTEEGFDGERTEEDDDEERDGEGDEEGDGLNEPQDLSLADYSRYDSAALPDAHADAAAGAEGTYVPGAGGPRIQATGKLNCDICGLSCVSINVLLVHKRSHTGERPFHCTQCGASFTQKGNLLRHIKLHSGEKPFKCPMCSYACRRRDALSGHLRTHSVEKPFKCNHCSRSYKQRSSLEEHRERCHVYLQSKGPAEREDSLTSRTQMGTERALLLDRLASNVAKRKSSMPQKFTGDNGVCLDLSFNRDLVYGSDIKDPPPGSPGPDTHHQQQAILTGPDSNPAPSRRPYPIQLSRNDISPMGLTNGHKMGMPLLGPPHAAQPPLGMDSFHTDGSQMSQPVMYSLGHLLGGLNHQNGIPHPHAQPIPLSAMEALRVVRADGEGGALPGPVYPCGHCRVIFLDYVMFTIHMGCHGFRDPLECNVCGHRSRDRYEFSSHIARGEHRLELK